MYKRRLSSETRVGQIGIGGNNPIRIQSMGTVDTNNTEGCVAQAKRIIDAGGELVRFTTQGTREAENMKNISARLKADGYPTPLVADVIPVRWAPISASVHNYKNVKQRKEIIQFLF